MNKYSSLISALILFGLSAGLYGLFFFYIQQQIAVAATAKQNAVGIQQQDQFQSSVASLLRSTDAERTELSLFVANDSTIVNIIQNIEDTAKTKHTTVSIDSVTVGTSKSKYHEPISITFTAQGSFQAIVALATAIESFPQASHLVRMNSQASTNHTWMASFIFEFLKEKAQAQQ